MRSPSPPVLDHEGTSVVLGLMMRALPAPRVSLPTPTPSIERSIRKVKGAEKSSPMFSVDTKAQLPVRMFPSSAKAPCPSTVAQNTSSSRSVSSTATTVQCRLGTSSPLLSSKDWRWAAMTKNSGVRVSRIRDIRYMT